MCEWYYLFRCHILWILTYRVLSISIFLQILLKFVLGCLILLDVVFTIYSPGQEMLVYLTQFLHPPSLFVCHSRVTSPENYFLVQKSFIISLPSACWIKGSLSTPAFQTSYIKVQGHLPSLIVYASVSLTVSYSLHDKHASMNIQGPLPRLYFLFILFLLLGTPVLIQSQNWCVLHISICTVWRRNTKATFR